VKTLFRSLALTILLAVMPVPCFALRQIGIVSKKEAQELGLELRATAAGPDAAWLELKFRPEGELKGYSHVELEIRDGEKLLLSYAALGEKRSSSGSVVVRFMAGRAFLEKITLTVVTGVATAHLGRELRMKDFVDLQKIR
jgi:hypothetical protein